MQIPQIEKFRAFVYRIRSRVKPKSNKVADKGAFVITYYWYALLSVYTCISIVYFMLILF